MNKRIKIIVTVEGGCVVNVHTSHPDADLFDVRVFDHDDAQAAQWSQEELDEIEAFADECPTAILYRELDE